MYDKNYARFNCMLSNFVSGLGQTGSKTNQFNTQRCIQLVIAVRLAILRVNLGGQDRLTVHFLFLLTYSPLNRKRLRLTYLYPM